MASEFDAKLVALAESIVQLGKDAYANGRRAALSEAAAYCDTMETGHRARAAEHQGATNIEAAAAQDRIANTWGVCATALRALATQEPGR